MSIHYTFQHGNLPDLTLVGDWLTQSGFPGQPLSIDVLPNEITIRADIGNMLT